MTKHSKIAVLIVVLILLGVFIYWYALPSTSPPVTQEDAMQALIDSTTAPKNTPPLTPQQSKKLIDSTSAPQKK